MSYEEISQSIQVKIFVPGPVKSFSKFFIFFIKIDAFLNPHQRGSYLFGKVLLYEKFSSILTISFYNVFPFPNSNEDDEINTAYNFINKM